MPATDSRTLEERLIHFFAACEDIRLAILFGSFAAGTATEASDIDIAIAAGPNRHDKLSIERRLELRATLSTSFKREIDLVDLARTEGLFLHRIMTGGLVLKDAHSLRLRLSQEALYFMADTWPILKRDQAIRVHHMFGGSRHGS